MDELLSSTELITLAKCKNSLNVKKIYSFIGGIIDVMVVVFIILPLYGKLEGDYIYSVNLLSFTDTTQMNLIIYWIVFILLIGLGVTRLSFIYFGKELWSSISTKLSIALGAVAICLFAAAREPYVTILLFMFFMFFILKNVGYLTKPLILRHIRKTSELNLLPIYY